MDYEKLPMNEQKQTFPKVSGQVSMMNVTQSCIEGENK
ncbi:hypothetical protein Bsph_4566 [Lysinibacillus sphaericus C3-41]|uniref:Uncharacterized protein n=1 Tax=Lysinibacillus sphaericus (strain C3-41) TaxID=444177 RepID=B1HMT4_LYSSC|nr:hypothetical protein Bsph_4566 [Lysinibacillus sphaericus C3-41]